jgi:hypothetical protein
MPLKVSATNGVPFVHTIDEQGLCQRSIPALIAHAANRYACKHGGKFYLNGFTNELDT